MSSEPVNPDASRRKTLKVAVGAVLSETGFGTAEDSAVETMTEMLQSCLTELGRTSRAFAELSYRTEVMPSDVVMAMVELGLNVESLPAYAKRTNKMMLMPPGLAAAPPPNRTLQAGQKKQRPPHIPDHLPIFPDPHTYIRTLTHKEPATEYQLVREKAASQKRDVERALTRFIAKTGETESLFQDDPYAYPLIANKPKPLPYLDALLPKDQDLESHEEAAKRPTTPPETVPVKPEKDSGTPKAAQAASSQETAQAGTALNKSGSQETAAVAAAAAAAAAASTEVNMESEGQIDNPYLRAIKMPKLKTTGKKHKW